MPPRALCPAVQTTVWQVLILFFNDTATTEIYTLSLHDALPVSASGNCVINRIHLLQRRSPIKASTGLDRKSTRLNSSHLGISYAVFCLQKNDDPNAVERPVDCGCEVLFSHTHSRRRSS